MTLSSTLARPPRSIPSASAHLEEIVFQAGRDALVDQDSVVNGIRQRTGTSRRPRSGCLLLGRHDGQCQGLHGFSWAALVALVLGLIISAVLLSNWKLRFAVDAPDLYAELYDEAAIEADQGTLGWLVSAAYGYHSLRRANAKRVRIMGVLLTVLGTLMVLQTIFWLVALR